MGKGIVKLGDSKWATKDGNLLAYKETNNRFTNTEFTFARGTDATYVGEDGLIKQFSSTLDNEVQNGDFSELGSELAVRTANTNQAFYFQKYSNNTITYDVGNTIITYVDDSGGGYSYFNSSYAIPTNLVVGVRYKISITFKVNTGNVKFRLWDGVSSLYTQETSSTSFITETVYMTAQSTSGCFIKIDSIGTGQVVTISDISVKQVDPDDDWTLGTGWSLGDGIASCDGTQVSNSIMYQDCGIVLGKQYQVIYTVTSYTSGSVLIYLGGTSAGAVSRSASGTYTQQFTAGGNQWVTLMADASFIGSVTNISVQDLTPIEDTPRIDFLDDTDGHLLLEPASTNLFTYSEDFSQSDWTKNDITVTLNSTTSPDGTNNATKLTSTADYAKITDTLTLSATTDYTVSFYTKNIDAVNPKISIWDNDNSVSLLSQTYGSSLSTSEWVRIEGSFTTTSGTSIQVQIVRDLQDTEEMYIWGAQVEALSYATSYIPTAGTTVTRDAETCNSAGTSADFNSEEGVFYAEIAALADDSTDRRITMSDGTTNNRMAIGFDNASNKIKYFLISSNSTQVNADVSVSNITQFNKIAFKYKLNDFALWVNGVEVDTDTLGSTFSANTLSVLSFAGYSGTTQYFYGKCKAIKVYKEALSDAELIALTT